MSKVVEPGDWIRFYQAGRLVVGVLQYITYEDGPCEPSYCTDIGVTASFVEKRSGDRVEGQGAK